MTFKEGKMIYNIYELKPIIDDIGKVWKGKESPKIIATINTGNQTYYEYMDDFYDKHYREDWVDSLDLDTTYYVINEDINQFSVISLHKDFCFYDEAEHDERVIIAVELGLSNNKAYI